MWKQNHEGPPHFSRHVREYLNANYEGSWIGQGGLVAWPARSQDSTHSTSFMGLHKI